MDPMNRSITYAKLNNYVFKERFSYGIATFVDKMNNSFGLDSFGSQILIKLAA